MRIILFLFFSAITCSGILAQNIENDIESDEWYKIHETNTLIMYVKFDIPDANKMCIGNNSIVPFIYRYKGSLMNREQYAVWELDYLDCGGITKKMTAFAPLSTLCGDWKNWNELEEFHYKESEEFVTAKKLVELRGSVYADKHNSPNSVQTTLKESIDPLFITTSKSTVRPLEEVVLTVEGGSLGQGGGWKLYEGSCGGSLIASSNDRSIKINPKKSSIYFIRAEGTHNNTNCVQIEINVDKSSKPPTSIEGLNEVCEGSSITLKQIGGELGPDSKWCWYADACGSNLIKKSTIASFEDTPKKTTVYWLRSESDDGMEKGPCIEKKVIVEVRPTSEFEIRNISNSSLICEGEDIVLKAVGILVEGASWVWKENNTKLSNNSNEIKRKPSKNSSYQLQIFSNSCGISEQSHIIEIQVYKKSISPNAITQRFDPKKSTKSQLYLEGGYLAEKSEWVWYYYNEKGKQVEIKRSKDDYLDVERGYAGKIIYLKAQGIFCLDETSAIQSKEVTFRKKSDASSGSGFALRYPSSKGKWFHFGLQGGVEYFSISDSIQNVDNSGDKESYTIESLTYFVGGEIHPIFKDQFYLGFHGGYGQYFKNYLNYEQAINPKNELRQTGSGEMTYFGGEMGWTISREHAAKMFIRYTRSGYQNNLTIDYAVFDSLSESFVSDRIYGNSQNVVIDRVTLGFRFGAFNARGKSNKLGNPKFANPFDLMINLHHQEYMEQTRMLQDFSSFSSIGNWRVGAGIGFWKHNILRIGFNIGFNSNFNQMFSSGNQLRPDYFVASIAYNFDLFR